MVGQTDQTFLGTGLAFPPRLEDGDFALVSGPKDIKEAILVILDTNPGERPMRPEFGAGLRQMVFAPLSQATVSLAQYRVRQALVRDEPRIDVPEVLVRPDPDRPGWLLIEVRYRVRESNTFFNLVYPFYLAEGRPA